MNNRITWLKTTQKRKIDELELFLEFERWDGHIGNIKAFEINKSSEGKYFVLVSLLPNDYGRNKLSLADCMKRAEDQLDIWLDEAGLLEVKSGE